MVSNDTRATFREGAEGAVVERPEAQLLRAALPANPERAEVRVRELVRRTELDWTFVIEQAHRHGVTGLVHDRLAGVEAVPERVQQALLQRRGSVLRHNMERLWELREIVEAFEAAGIPVMPFKGPVLAQQYYDDLAFRRYLDLDLLVRREDVLRAKEVLLRRGYEPRRDLDAREEARFIDDQMAYEFVREADRIIVEVHWAFIHKIHAFRLDPEAVWARAQRVDVGGRPVPTLADEDLILYLAAHGSKHGWYRLLWACDMDRVVRAHARADWAAIRRRARAMGSERMLLLGLHVANRWLGTPLPAALAAPVQETEALRHLAEYVEEKWLFADGTPKEGSLMTQSEYLLRTHERWRDRWAYYKHLARLAVTPTEKDRAALPVPAALSFLHYAIRPFRILRDWVWNGES